MLWLKDQVYLFKLIDVSSWCYKYCHLVISLLRQ